MTTVWCFSRFANEYDFLEARLSYFSTIAAHNRFHFKQFILVEPTFWSGKVNLIDYERFELMRSSYELYVIPSPVVVASDSSTYSRRDREDLATASLVYESFKILSSSFRNGDLIVYSDLDEVFSANLISRVQTLSCSNVPIYIRQRTVWFSSRFVYNEPWRGPVVYNSLPSESLCAVSLLSRFYQERRSTIIDDGLHISFFRGTIESKKNNSHGIRHFSLRRLLTRIGLHPFRIQYLSSRPTPEESDILKYFQHLSY
jgi:hypothetical protein